MLPQASVPSSSHCHEIRLWSKLLLASVLILDLAHFWVAGYSLLFSVFWGQKSSSVRIVQWSVPLALSTLFFMLAGWRPFTRNELLWLGSAGFAFVSGLVAMDSPQISSIDLGATLCLGLLPLAYYLPLKAAKAAWQARATGQRAPAWTAALVWLTLAVVGLVVGTAAMLRLNGALLPLTFDYHLYKIDTAFGGAARWAAQWVGRDETRALSLFTHQVYGVLGFLLFPLLALLVREDKVRSLHGWRTLFIPYVVGTLCYLWLPATGPLNAIGGYPVDAVAPQELQALLVSVIPAPRNAMPSLHLSSAIWILMIAAALRRKWVFTLSVLFALGTAWATLALGEHYVIDLVVAMPFAPVLGLLLLNAPRWRVAPRWAHGLQWAAGGSFVLWMLLLRLMPEWLQLHPGFVQAFSVWSVGVGLVLLGLHVRSVWREEDTNEVLLQQSAPALAPAPFVMPTLLPVELAGKRWLVGIFFFSGFAGLVYEVVYAKALGVTFGGTALAANTVLMTYMGGMALGAWLGGMVAEKSRKPLLLYALFEAAIGIYAAITPWLFSGIQSLYVALAFDTPPDAAGLTALRMALGAAVLGVPTVLMGATLPLVFQCLRSMGIPTSRAIAPLYAANVLGAAAGALVAGYALLPAVGRNGGTLLAAVISLMVALYVIEKIKHQPGQFERDPVLDSVQEVAQTLAAAPARALGLAALTVLTLGGVVTLALEVVFMHLLAVVAGNSVYAFGLMLATFLLGLGLGSTVGERLMLRAERATLVLWAQCGIALAILLTAFVWDGLADYMGSFGYAQQQGIYLGFSARELVRALVCALAMLPPAFFIGMSYPAAMGLAADWLAAARFGGQAARGVGLASAANTLGNIAGVLLAGFWWLPMWGSRNVLLGLAVVAVLLAALMAMSMASVAGEPGRLPEKTRALRRWAPVAAMGAGLLLFPAQWNYTALSQGGNVYFSAQQWGEVIDQAESVEGGLTTVAKGGESHLTLLTNGKFQGNNSEEGEMVAQESFALLPLLHTTQRNEALVIGYGTGMTARVLQDQGFAKLDVVELSRDIVTMADKHFANINARISSHPSVKMHYTDGRNYLLTQSQQYDLISLEISSIWFAGAANLYNREFYELASKRLNPHGVLQQWVQLHHMQPMDFLYIMGSVRSVFKYVWVYVSGGQGIIVASNDDASIDNRAALEKLVNSHTISKLQVADLPRSLVATPAQVDALVQRYDPSMQFFISTDKNLYLEYSTPKGNAMREDSMPILVDMLQGRQ